LHGDSKGAMAAFNLHYLYQPEAHQALDGDLTSLNVK
jgi:hypothetical protein